MVPVNTTHWINVVLMLVHRLRRWPLIKTTSVQRLVFTVVIFSLIGIWGSGGGGLVIDLHSSLFISAYTMQLTHNCQSVSASVSPFRPYILPKPAHVVMSHYFHPNWPFGNVYLKHLTLWPPNYSIWIFTHLKLWSLTRSTTSSEWKLFRFDKIEVNCFRILLIDVTFYL